MIQAGTREIASNSAFSLTGNLNDDNTMTTGHNVVLQRCQPAKFKKGNKAAK